MYYAKLPRHQVTFIPITLDAQMQADCGLFAIAFANALVLGFNPGQYFFEQLSIRRYLWNSLWNQNM